MKEADLVEVVRQAVFLQRVAQPDIEYTLLLPSTEISFDGDARLVSQALTNILKNAAEGIEGKVGAVDSVNRIETSVILDGEMISIIITDNGRGLPRADRRRLTEPYMTTRAKGTGLGLAIVKKIMEDHGGTLELSDAPSDEGWESGARIVLCFPRVGVLSNDEDQVAGGADKADGLSVVASKVEATDGV